MFATGSEAANIEIEGRDRASLSAPLSVNPKLGSKRPARFHTLVEWPGNDPGALFHAGGAAAVFKRSSRHSHQATPPMTKAPPATCAIVGASPPIASSATATTGTRLV